MNRPKRKLIVGRMMVCPRCKKEHDLLQYVPLRMIEEFVTETTPIYKCPSCRWIFAPADHLLADAMLSLSRGNSSEGVTAK